MIATDGYTCPKHPKEVTYLRCASCNVPICGACAIQTPVGYKCRTCCGNNLPSLAPALLHVMAVLLIGIAAGALGGSVLRLIGFFGIWLSLLYGRFIGGLMLKASRQRSSLLMEIIAGIAILIGSLGPRLFAVWSRAHVLGMQMPVPAFFDLYSLLIAVVIAGSAISRLRWSWSYGGTRI